MSQASSDGGTVLFAFLAGAIIGVGVGLLVAPRPGSETRRQLTDLAQKAQDRAGDIATRLRQRTPEGAGGTEAQEGTGS